jgi:hypothetical protein
MKIECECSVLPVNGKVELVSGFVSLFSIWMFRCSETKHRVRWIMLWRPSITVRVLMCQADDQIQIDQLVRLEFGFGVTSLILRGSWAESTDNPSDI